VRHARALQKVVSWVVVASGIGVGVFICSFAGARSIWGWEDLLRCLAVLLCGMVSIVSAFWAMRSRKRAARWYLFAAIPAFFSWLAQGHSYTMLQDTAQGATLVGVLLVTPGLFWLVTHKFRWPELLGHTVFSRLLLTALAVATAGIVFCETLAVMLRSNIPIPGRCDSTSVITSPLDSDHTMFLAHPLFPSHPPETVLDYYNPDYYNPFPGVLVVDHEYWGLPWWNHWIVAAPLPRVFGNGQFLVEAERHDGLLSRLIPIPVYLPRGGCGQSGTVPHVQAQLRILREGKPKSGARIIGEVEGIDSDMRFSGEVAGAEVVISGPEGDTHAITDESGVYDVNGLPPGRYRVRIFSPNRAKTHDRDLSAYLDAEQEGACGGDEGMPVPEGQVWGCRLVKYHPMAK
jgi:hypothetical protein